MKKKLKNQRAFFIQYETKKAQNPDFSDSPPTPSPPVSMRQKMSQEHFATLPYTLVFL